MAAIPLPASVRIRVESNRTFIRATAAWIATIGRQRERSSRHVARGPAAAEEVLETSVLFASSSAHRTAIQRLTVSSGTARRLFGPLRARTQARDPTGR